MSDRTRLRARLAERLFDAGLGPGGLRSVLVIGLLSVVRAVALVMIAESLAGSISAIAGGARGWQSVIVVGVVGAALRAGSTWAIGTIAAHEAVTAKTRIRGRLAERIAGGGVDSGSAAVLATTGVDDLDDYYGSVIPAAVAALVVPVVLGARILSLDWLSAVVIAVTLPLVPLFMALIGMHTRERTDAASRALHRLADHLVELAHGLPVLVGLGRVDEQTEALEGIQSDLRRRTTITLRTAFLSALALELIGTLSVAVVAVLLGIRLMNGGVPLITALVVLLLAPECFSAVREVGAAFHASQNGTAALRRLRDLLATARRATRTVAGRDVEVAGLRVCYPARDGAAVEGFSAVFPRGRMSAVVGPSGAGKSTMLSALAGTLEPDAELSGRIRGVDPERLALAAQAPRFFGDTVAGELELAEDDSAAVDEILHELELDAVRDRRPSELSPGESRRLAVARAALRVRAGATTALFDEPTAHLDERAAGRVRNLLRSLTRSAAVIVVSHDPALISIADAVIRMPEPAAPPAPSARQEQSAAAGAGQPLGAPSDRADRADHGPAESPVTPLAASPAAPAGSTLLSLLRASAGRWVLAVLLGVAATGFGLSLTAVSAWLIVRASEHPEIMYLLVAIVGVRFFGLGRSVARYAERLVTHGAILTATDSMRVRIWRGIAARGAGSRRLQEGGAAVDYLVTSLDELRDLVPRVVTPLAVAGLGLAGIVTTIALIEPAVAAPVGLILVGAAVGVPLLVRRADAAGSAGRVPARAELGGRIAALAGAAPELRANGMSRAAVAQVGAAASRLAALDRRVARSSGAGSALVALVTGGLAVLIPLLATSAGAPSAETVAVVSLLVLASSDPLADGMRAVQRAPALAAVLGRLRPFHDAPVVTEGGAVTAHPIAGIRLDALSARWPGAAAPVFAGLEARVQPGRWLVVDGSSGSGKSTLLTLLLGALEPDAGRILVDDVPLTRLSREDWHTRVAWCPQEAHVFDSTIRANLLLARPRTDPVSDGEMRHVLARVGLRPLLERLPDGLDARVGASGGSLSGGERQRLAVARALLGRSELLLLDEPTAHLDEPTAAAMMADIRSATGDRMVVLVTHRAEDRSPSDRALSLAAVGAPVREAVSA